MKKATFFVICCLSLILLSKCSMSQWHPVSDIYGGSYSSIACNNGNIFVASYNYGGVSYSSNNGVSWAQTNLRGKISSLLIYSNYVYAGSEVGVWLSSNNGTNWILYSNNILNVTTLIASGQNILAGTEANGVYCSNDSGRNWVQSNLNNKNILCFASDDSIALCGTYYYGLYKSTDHGITWSSHSFQGFSVISLLLKDNYIFAYYRYGGYGFMKSTNYGANWSQITFTGGVNSLDFSDSILFAGSDYKGVWKSTDMGNTWTYSNDLASENDVLVVKVSGNRIFAGASNGANGVCNGGLFVSTNLGQNWIKTEANTLKTNSLEFSNGAIYCGTEQGIYKSTNNGNDWEHLTSFRYNNIDNFCSNEQYLIVKLNGPVYKSSDEGNYWYNLGLSDITETCITYFNDIIFVGAVAHYPYIWGGLRRFQNGGWVTSMQGQSIYSLFHNNNFVLMSFNSNPFCYSSNNGDVWNNTNLNKTVLGYSYNSDYDFAGTNGDGIYRSSNNGINWSKIGLDSMQIKSVFCRNNNIFVGSFNKGVYLSSNNGNNWIAINEGLGNLTVNDIIVVGDYVYCATAYNSLWFRPLSEIVDIKNISTEVPSAYSLKQNYPNPFNNTSNLKFQIVNTGDVKLIVYDIMGKEVQTLVNERLQPGTYETSFDGSALNSGVYFYKLITDGFTETKKMILIK